jgi:hypothetical protein
MSKPWITGPRELLQHALEHLTAGSDFDKRIALISIDSAVEISIKTFLDLPRRINAQGPSKKTLAEQAVSFPGLLSLLEKYALDRLECVDLQAIEWFHRVRNELYHSGNGMTVEGAVVSGYLELAITLFQALFDCEVCLDDSIYLKGLSGKYLISWREFDKLFRSLLPERNGEMAFYWKRNFLKKVSPVAIKLYNEVIEFHMGFVLAGESADLRTIQRQIDALEQLVFLLRESQQ